MKIKDAIFFIGTGLSLGLTLIVYAHSSFSTKDSVKQIEEFQKEKEMNIIRRLDRMESKLDNLITRSRGND